MNQKIEYEFFENYLLIPKEHRSIIMRKLGISSGMMRPDAKELNPSCVVAYIDNVPIGWTCVYKYSKSEKLNTLNVFVSKKFRGKSIGFELIKRICDRLREKEDYSDKYIAKVFPYNQDSFEFFYKFNLRYNIGNTKGLKIFLT